MLSMEDAPAIADLLNRVFRSPTSVDDWRWFVTGSPWGAGRTYGARDLSGRVIACYGALPARLNVGGEQVNAAYGHHLAIDPAVRSAALFVQLSQEVMRSERERGTRLVLGAANARAYPLHRRLAGWRDVGELDVAHAVPNEFGDRVATRLVPIEFDAECIDVVSHVTRSLPWSFDRDSAWLEWRYVLRPAVTYQPLGLREGGELRAWGVIKRYQDPTGPVRLHVMELWGRDTRSAAAWLRAVVRMGRGAEEVNAWVSVTSPLHAAYVDAGFLLTAERRQKVIVRPLHAAPVLPDAGVMSFGDADGF